MQPEVQTIEARSRRRVFCRSGEYRGRTRQAERAVLRGFKSVLQDLAMIAYGLKKSVAFLGNKSLTLDDARTILSGHDDIIYRQDL
jgi:hypothetical protein